MTDASTLMSAIPTKPKMVNVSAAATSFEMVYEMATSRPVSI